LFTKKLLRAVSRYRLQK